MERFARLRSINGLAVEHARSGEESLVLVRVLLPELVLISNDIADMSPVHLAQRLRASVPSETVPIVVVGLDHTAIERSILSNESVSLVADKSPTEKQAELAGETATDEHRQRNGEANCSESQANLTCHDVRLDRNKHGVWVQDRAVRLTPTEFKLLWELASRPGYVLSRKELSQRCKRADRSSCTFSMNW